MSTREISFIANILLFKYKFINQSDNKLSFNETVYNLSDGVNKFLMLEISYKENDRFILIAIKDGLSKPRPDTVHNILTLDERPNPREDFEVEAKISYALIDTKSSLLWISNYKKKSTLLDFLKNQQNCIDIELKNIYNEKEFVDTLNSISGISISAEPSIFIEHELSANLINDPLGYNAEIATLNFKYKHAHLLDKLRDNIRSLIDKKDSFKRIVITGRDKNDIGMTFNTNIFSRRIEFRSTVDDNGMFIQDEMFNNLISQIKNEE